MNRRTILAGVSLIGAIPSFVAAQTPYPMPRGQTPPDGMMDPASARTEADFRMGVIGPAELSLATSRIAMDKATNRNADEFAGFEMEEAVAVTSVLKDLNTPVPAPDEKARMILQSIESTRRGPEFDRIYIQAQLENHEYLRDLAMGYLRNSRDATDPAEKHGRHLATLSLAVFKEHVAITQRIANELRG